MLGVGHMVSWTSYFVVATVSSQPQLNAAIAKILAAARDIFGLAPLRAVSGRCACFASEAHAGLAVQMHDQFCYASACALACRASSLGTEACGKPCCLGAETAHSQHFAPARQPQAQLPLHGPTSCRLSWCVCCWVQCSGVQEPVGGPGLWGRGRAPHHGL